jgi:hypothetical protein
MGFDFKKYEKEQKEVMMQLHQETQKIKALMFLANEQSFFDDHNYNNHQVHYSNNGSKKQEFCEMEVA